MKKKGYTVLELARKNTDLEIIAKIMAKESDFPTYPITLNFKNNKCPSILMNKACPTYTINKNGKIIHCRQK